VIADNGGFTVAGYNNFVGAGNDDLMVMHFDGNANIVWARTLGGTNSDKGLGLVWDGSGYGVVGTTGSFGAGNNDILVARFLSNGNLDWVKTFGGTGNDSGNDIVWDGTQYGIAGTTGSFGAGADDFALLRVTTSGGLTFARALGGGQQDRASGIAWDGSSYAIAGNSTSFTAGNTDFLIAKVSTAPAVTWGRRFGGSNNDIGRDVIWDGTNFVMAGHSNTFGAGDYDAVVVRFKTDGSGIDWARTIGGAGQDQALSMSYDSGNYLVTGYTMSNGLSDFDAYAASINASGTLGWATRVGKTSGAQQSDHALAITKVGSGYVMVGYTSSYNAGGWNEMLVARLNSSGGLSTGCSEVVSAPFSVTLTQSWSNASASPTLNSTAWTTGTPSPTYVDWVAHSEPPVMTSVCP
jgi:hypothetical protein